MVRVQSIGSPKSLSQAQLALLMEASELRQDSIAATSVEPLVELQLQVPRQGVAVLTFALASPIIVE